MRPIALPIYLVYRVEGTATLPQVTVTIEHGRWYATIFLREADGNIVHVTRTCESSHAAIDAAEAFLTVHYRTELQRL